MIDKLNILHPGYGSLRPEFLSVLHGARTVYRERRQQSDLRPVGVDAFFFLDKYGRPNLELIDVARKGFSGAHDTISRVFKGNPNASLLKRVDFCADVQGVPISFFTSTDVRYKTSHDSWRNKGKHKGTTFSWGAGDDKFVIYDKASEALAGWRKQAAGPSFEDVHGFDQEAVVSRVERQMRNRVLHGKGFEAVADLSRADKFNPFQLLSLPQAKACRPLPSNMGWKDRAAVLHVRSLEQRGGLPAVKAFIAEYSSANLSRELKSVLPYLGSEYDAAISDEKLLELYRDSTVQWLAA